MTIVITVKYKGKIKFEPELQLKLLRAMALLNEIGESKYHEHTIAVSCSQECIDKTIGRMGLG